MHLKTQHYVKPPKKNMLEKHKSVYNYDINVNKQLRCPTIIFYVTRSSFLKYNN